MKIKKDFIQLSILFSAAILLIAFSSNAKSGAADGLKMAMEIVVPSLLPLLIIFNLISNAETKRLVETALAPIAEKVFRLPRNAAGAMLFGLIGGYPTGALLTQGLYENNDIDSETAKRLLRFNVNGGAAFIITAVGSSILKSEKAGMILFASTTLSALFIAFASSFRYKKVKNNMPYCSCLPFGDALFTLPELAALLAFAGFCIHFQLLSVIKKVGMRYFDFFIWRVVHAVCAYMVCSLLLRIFPTETAVFSNFSDITAEPVSISAALSVLMIMSCAVIVLDIESKKRKI